MALNTSKCNYVGHHCTLKGYWDRW